jgi:hypothetical protein
MKLRPVGAELFHAYRRTDGHEEANFAIFRTRLKSLYLMFTRSADHIIITLLLYPRSNDSDRTYLRCCPVRASIQLRRVSEGVVMATQCNFYRLQLLVFTNSLVVTHKRQETN